MVVYLTNARCWLQWKRNERICELGGLEYLLKPYARLDERMHTVLDPEVGSSLDDKYSVTQSLPGDYYYVKWWDGGTIPRARTKKARNKNERRNWRRKAQLLCFYHSLYLGDSGNSDSAFFVFRRVWPSSIRGFPKSRLCLCSALAVA